MALLTISDLAIAAFAADQVAASRSRIAAYLRENAPQHLAATTDADLLARIELYESQALSLGLEAERDIARWAFLQVLANDTLFAMPVVRAEFDPAASGRLPGDTLDVLFDELTARLRRLG